MANFPEEMKKKWSGVLGMVLLWVICGLLIIIEWETNVSYIFFLVILFMNIYKSKLERVNYQHFTTLYFFCKRG